MAGLWERATRAALEAAAKHTDLRSDHTRKRETRSSQPDDRYIGKGYSVGIVGESHYQDEIEECEVGESVFLLHEPDNPYDDRAIAVVSERDETIGYVPRDSFVQAALLDEGHGYSAEIRSIGTGTKGLYGVVIELALSGEQIGERKYRR